MLKALFLQGVVPNSFGLTPNEWESDNYLVYETIHIGQYSSKELHVTLSEKIGIPGHCGVRHQSLNLFSYLIVIRTSYKHI
jgi:hypothetical protein